MMEGGAEMNLGVNGFMRQVEDIEFVSDVCPATCRLVLLSSEMLPSLHSDTHTLCTSTWQVCSSCNSTPAIF